MKRKLDENNTPSTVRRPSQTPLSSFESLNLDPRLLQAVTKEQYSVPTLIQAEAIPLVLEGKDILGRLQNLLLVQILTRLSSGQDRFWQNRCVCSACLECNFAEERCKDQCPSIEATD